ncbi:unnamed protein product [Musa textilis]
MLLLGDLSGDLFPCCCLVLLDLAKWIQHHLLLRALGLPVVAC